MHAQSRQWHPVSGRRSGKVVLATFATALAAALALGTATPALAVEDTPQGYMKLPDDMQPVTTDATSADQESAPKATSGKSAGRSSSSGDDQVTHGPCGPTSVDQNTGEVTVADNVTWSYSAGTLTISGSGEMDTWNYDTFWGQDVFPGWRSAGLNDQITRVVVESGVTKVGSAAFAQMPNLTSVSLSPTVTEIGWEAFRGDTKLTAIKLNEGLTTIRGMAFNDSGIQTIEIPSTVSDMASTMFGDAKYDTRGTTHGLDVSGLKISPKNPYYKLSDNVLYKCENGRPVELVHSSTKYPPTGMFRIPSGIKKIASQAFADTDITGVVLNPELESVGSDAFFGTKLTSVTIPDNVKSLDWSSFGNIATLRSVTVGSGLTEINGFQYDQALTSVHLSEGPTKIVDRAFGMAAITSIDIPKSVTEIGEEIFVYCKNLTTVNMPNVKSIGYAAFAECSKLASVSLPQTLERIDKEAFYGTALSEVNIPASVTYIGPKAFPEGTKLLELPSTLVKMPDGSYQLGATLQIEGVSYVTSDARGMLSQLNAFRTGGDAWYWNQDDASKTQYNTSGNKSLSALTYDYTLERLAMQRAAEIAVLYTHKRPDGTYASSSLSGYSAWGENIAYGYGSATAVMDAWKEANVGYSGQGHRRNMLSENFNAVGIGHVRRNGVDYWVQEFGYKKSPDTAASSKSVNNEVAATSTADLTVKQDNVTSVGSVTPSTNPVLIQQAGGTASAPTAILTGIELQVANGSYYWDGTPAYDTGTIDKATAHVQWASSDSSIVTVDGQTLTRKGEGRTTISSTVLGKALQVTVTDGKKVDLAKAGAKVSAIPDQTYTGSALTPAPTVTLGGATLASGSDYTLSYASNTNAGTATVTVNGTGDYTGTVTSTFRIVPVDLAKATIAAIPDQAYTGSAVTPEPTVTLGGRTLVSNTDYTVSYANNVNLGTATLTVTGTGNYAGAKTATFKIADPKSIKPATVKMQRLYNPNSGEHFYTASMGERDHLVSVGWKYEGVGWTAPSSGDPVYRLYNSNAGDHHYTKSVAERNMLVSVGWNYEGIGWYSEDAERGVPLYRQYNPNAKAGAHNYTTSKVENDYLVSLGWRAEGIAWYGVKS